MIDLMFRWHLDRHPVRLLPVLLPNQGQPPEFLPSPTQPQPLPFPPALAHQHQVASLLPSCPALAHPHAPARPEAEGWPPVASSAGPA